MDFIYHEELEAIQEAMRQHGEHACFRPASKEDLIYLKEIGVPDSVSQFYEIAEPDACIEISDARLWPVSDLRLEN